MSTYNNKDRESREQAERWIPTNAYADRHPTHNVHITFDADTNPNIRDRRADAYALFFGLPRVLREYLLFDEARGIRLAPGLKRKFFSEITVYRRVDDRDVLYRHPRRCVCA